MADVIFKSLERGEGEDFQDYRLRRKLANAEKSFLKYGTLFYDSANRGPYVNFVKRHARKLKARNNQPN